MTGLASIELGVVLDNLFLGHATSGHIGALAIADSRAWKLGDSTVLWVFTCGRYASVGRSLLVGVGVLEDSCGGRV